MAQFYAVKSPSGEYTDFTKAKRASINRFLRRQEDWDSLWVDWQGAGFSIKEVDLPVEEAQRMNHELDYYRDSTKPVKVRERQAPAWLRTAPVEQSAASIEARITPTQEKPPVAPEPVVEPEPRPSMEPAFTAQQEPDPVRDLEDRIEPVISAVDDFEINDDILDQHADAMEVTAREDDFLDDFEGELGQVRVVTSKKPVESVPEESVPAEPVAPVVAEASDVPVMSEAEEVAGESEKPEFIDVRSFLSRNKSTADVVETSRPVSVSVPKSLQRRAEPKNNDLMWPQFIASAEDDELSASDELPKSEPKDEKPGAVVSIAEYAPAEPEPVDNDAMEHQYAQVAFSEGGDELSAPRVITREEAKAKEEQRAKERAEAQTEESAGNPFASSQFTRNASGMKPLINGSKVAYPSKPKKTD